jgi:hypothetical protein
MALAVTAACRVPGTVTPGPMRIFSVPSRQAVIVT